MGNFKKLLLALVFFTGSFAFAQSHGGIKPGSATISADYCIALDANAEIQDYYEADASALNWSSAQEAKKMCGMRSNNLVSLSADYANNKIMIEIHTDRTYDAKDIVWWNAYLDSLCQ